MTYAEKLKDPRWQKRRLEVLEAAGWKCQACKATDKTLHVHHNFYRTRTHPWDYPNHAFLALCEQCHQSAECQRQELLQCIENIYESKSSADFVGAVIGFLKAAYMDYCLDDDPSHSELLRNRQQAWGFARFWQGDERDLLPLLNNGEVTDQMVANLWKAQAARLQKRIEVEAKYDEEVTHA